MSNILKESIVNECLKVSKECAKRCMIELSSRYDFDVSEAMMMIEEEMRKLCGDVNKVDVKKVDVKKVDVKKSLFPLPWSGEIKEECCHALRQNNGLYTQCMVKRNGENKFCKGCGNEMMKSGSESPEYGTIEDRMKAGLLEYIDPKGRKEVAYTKIMKKLKLTKEMVMEEAEKLNIKVDPIHFEVKEEIQKRGRPATKTEEVKEKGQKGRPKKTKKVVELEGESEDLFASLVMTANMEANVEGDVAANVEGDVVANVEGDLAKENNGNKQAEKMEKEEMKKADQEARAMKKKISEEERAAKKKADEEERLAKKNKADEERAAKKKADEEERAAKKKAAEEERAAKKKADEEERAAKKKAADEERAAKKKAETKKTETKKEETKKEENDNEQDVVKKIEFEGKKYLKSKKTGIIYDYQEYVELGEQVVLGKWNETTNKIDFDLDNEEVEEEEYN
jgi:hypothetical protein